MASPFENLPKTSFGAGEAAIVFPSESTTLEGTGRHHVHIYPHSPGGAPEKLGRDLYRIQMRGIFMQGLRGYAPDLWPTGIQKMRMLYELQMTLPLMVPTVGTIQAFIVQWRQVKDAKINNGEKVDVTFLEDQSTQNLVESLLAPGQAGMASAASQLGLSVDEMKAASLLTGSDITVFDAITSMTNSVLAYRDTAGMYGNLLVDKVAGLTNLCQQADSLVSMQDVQAWPVVNVLHDLWDSARQLKNDLQSRQGALQSWTVPSTMSLAEVAAALLNDAGRQTDLMPLNPGVDDPMRVTAGTTIRYYPAA